MITTTKETATENDISDLIEAVEVFHKTIYASNESLSKFSNLLLERVVGLAFWVCMLIIFDMVLFATLILKGVL